MRTAVNLNDDVYFTPTQQGLAHWKDYMDNLHEDLVQPVSVYQQQVQEDGTVRMKLHKFMRVFGPVMNAHSDEYLDVHIHIEHA